MSYAVTMTLGFCLNSANAHTRAAVVLGTAWKRHISGNNGELQGKGLRGSLILWVRTHGEEEAVRLSVPMASPLKDGIDRLNTVQVFERFKCIFKKSKRRNRWKTSPISNQRRIKYSLTRLSYGKIIFAELKRQYRRDYSKASFKRKNWRNSELHVFIACSEYYNRKQQINFFVSYKIKKRILQARRFSQKRISRNFFEIMRNFDRLFIHENEYQPIIIFQVVEQYKLPPWNIQPRPPSAPLAPPVI